MQLFGIESCEKGNHVYCFIACSRGAVRLLRRNIPPAIIYQSVVQRFIVLNEDSGCLKRHKGSDGRHVVATNNWPVDGASWSAWAVAGDTSLFEGSRWREAANQPCSHLLHTGEDPFMCMSFCSSCFLLLTKARATRLLLATSDDESVVIFKLKSEELAHAVASASSVLFRAAV